MDNAERWAYARRVMSNASEHYRLVPHPEIKPEWIEKIIAEHTTRKRILQTGESYTSDGLTK